MEAFALENFVTLGLLTLLQAVLGFDNLLYISLESKRAPADRQAYVRKVGIALAIILRIVLLFALMSLIRYFQNPLFAMRWTGVVEGEVNLHSLIVLFGGAFILYTASKEILHMMSLEDEPESDGGQKSVGSVIFWIVMMNLVFSFDSILSAMALTQVFWVMASAIVIGGILMIWLADRVSVFLQKNRMYEVLGLFVLFVVGIMLVSEGGHLAHLKLFGSAVMPMTKTTFYFVIGVLVLTDIVQSRYQRKILRAKAQKAAAASS
ncbi:MAG: tellurium resistance protein TerC [Acidobacteriota bacterium]